MSVATLAWGTPLRKKITAIFGTLGAVATAVAAVPSAWSTLGLPEIASKHWVHVEIAPLRLAQSSAGQTLKNIQLDIAEGKRSQVEDAIAKWNLELGRAKPGSSTQSMIQGQIRELEATHGKLDDQIKTLQHLDGR